MTVFEHSNNIPRKQKLRDVTINVKYGPTILRNNSDQEHNFGSGLNFRLDEVKAK